MLDDILALFRIVCRIVQHSGPLTHLDGDAELVAGNKGTIAASYHSRPSSVEILRFIADPFRAAQGENVKNCQLFAIAFEACTDRSLKNEELFHVRTGGLDMYIFKLGGGGGGGGLCLALVGGCRTPSYRLGGFPTSNSLSGAVRSLFSRLGGGGCVGSGGGGDNPRSRIYDFAKSFSKTQ